tara:strand:+ start:177 stop:779 length:603 start_codon:yes stop_codon:yes gene_type:complete
MPTKERIKYNTAYYAKNKEKILENSKENYKKHKEEKLIYSKEYRKNNLNKIKERDKIYYAKNKERIRDQRQTRYRLDLEFKEKRIANSKVYWLTNKEKIVKHRKEFYEENKSNILSKSKLKIKNDRKEIFRLEGGKCLCCGMDDPMYFQIDHVYNDGNGRVVSLLMYLATPERYQLLCANCNISKHLNGGKLYKPKKKKG